MTTIRHLAVAGIMMLALSGQVLAAGSSSTSDSTSTYSSDATTQAFRDGQSAVDAGNWGLAIGYFETAVSLDPGSADAFNMLAYSQRQSGGLESAFVNYRQALTIDPDHKEAHEYLGEAYLQAGDLAAAQEQLEALDDICWLGCDALTELREAIETWQADNS